MRTAIYIDDGVLQIILTPETDFEKSLVKQYSNTNMSVSIKKGKFYSCVGGWIRTDSYEDESLMIILKEKALPSIKESKTGIADNQEKE